MMLYFFMLPTALVRMENGFCEASGLDQREAQNARVRCHREQSRVNVVCDNHAVDQHCIDVYKRQGQTMFSRLYTGE